MAFITKYFDLHFVYIAYNLLQSDTTTYEHNHSKHKTYLTRPIDMKKVQIKVFRNRSPCFCSTEANLSESFIDNLNSEAPFLMT